MKKSNAILKDVNPRKENHGDELKLAADLKLEVVLPFTVLHELTSTDVPWEFFCWDKSTEEVRPMGIDHFALDTKLDDHVIHLTIGENVITFDGVTLKKFRAKPIDGKRVELSFQAQIYPVKDHLAMLGEVLMEQVKVKIDPPRQQDLLETKKETADADA
jgi:hypothetical protein